MTEKKVTGQGTIMANENYVAVVVVGYVTDDRERELAEAPAFCSITKGQSVAITPSTDGDEVYTMKALCDSVTISRNSDVHDFLYSAFNQTSRYKVVGKWDYTELK